jgi:gliding motility-associated-like protein
MTNRKGIFSVVLTCMLSALVFSTSAQCVLINEIMVNPAGGCDGSCTPSTEEWFELYNTCSEDVDLSCFVITDGDFGITLPAGTIIPANGYFVIGSVNSLVPIDLDLGTCGCTSGASNQVGIFTNSHEQLVITDPTGVFQDAIYWGTGQFAQTPSFTTNPIGNCASITINLDATNPAFEPLLTQSSNSGFTAFRTCDGGSTWQNGGIPPTPGATNGGTSALNAVFSATQTTICQGACIDFTNITAGSYLTSAWQFEGSSTPTSNTTNPTSICYPDAGTFDVTLTVTEACGSNTITLTDFITVTAGDLPVITADGPLSFCQGDDIVLSTISSGNLQWYENGNPMPGENGPSISITTSGDYFVTSTTGNCSNTSETYSILVTEGVNAEITYENSLLLCDGSSVLLSTASGFSNYQWYLNNDPIPNANSASYVADEAGSYTVEVSSGTCSGASSPVIVETVITETLQITPSGTISLCPGETISLTATSNFTNYVWYNIDNLIADANNNILDVTETGLYHVTAIDANGCSAISNEVSITSEVINAPTIAASNDGILCAGSEVSMVTNPNYSSYQWYFNDQPMDGETLLSVNVFAPGIYYCIVSNGTCEASTPTVEVIENTLTNIDLQPNSVEVLCPSEEFFLTATEGFDNYIWYINDGFLINTNSNQLLVDLGGLYSVTGTTTIGGCIVNSNQVDVSFSEILFPQITSPITSICQGETLPLSTSPQYSSYQWYIDGNEIPGAITNTYEVSQTGVYSVIVTSNAGCEFESNLLLITVSPIPVINLSISGPIETCIGVFNLQAFMQNGTAVSWQWYDDAPIANQNSSSINLTEDGTYYVEATSTFGCTAQSNPFEIIFLTPTNIQIVASDETPCVGDIVELTISGDYESLLWLDGSDDEVVNVTSTGVYSVVATGIEGCTDSDLINITFTPLPNVDAGQDALGNCEDGIELDGTATGNFSWSPTEGLSNPNILNPIATPVTSTVYTLTSNVNGCIATDEVIVVANCGFIIIPNVFTPNGDSDNEEFEIFNFGIPEYEIKIYNRWGDLMFESTNSNKHWDGQQNSTPAAEGTYYYTLIANDANGNSLIQENQKSGTLQLLR